jgi:hypothetical protein
MTREDLLKFNFARSPMWDNNVVKIERVREDENGVPLIEGMVGGKTCLFRVSELTDFRA